MLNKKSIEFSLTVVVVALVLLISAFIILAVFKGFVGRENEQAKGLIADGDGDGIMDVADKRPCTPGVADYGGCSGAEQLKRYEDATNKVKFECSKT